MTSLMTDTTNSMPLLKPMRNLRSLSQRALAEKSGVAHDTIGQIERGERRARPATVRKLAAALEVDPYILRLSHREIVLMWEGFESGTLLFTDDDPELRPIRDYLVHAGLLEDQDSASLVEQRVGDVSLATFEHFEDVSIAVSRAQTKLLPFDPLNSMKGEIVEGVEAALLLARSYSRLLQLLAEQLEAGIYDRTSSVLKLGELRRSLVETWLEGAAATKEFTDIFDKAPRPLGESALEEESENGGGDQQE